jgi:hypothetical protein
MVMTKYRVIWPGFGKADDFVNRIANIVRDSTIFGSKSPDILIKNIEIAGVNNHYWEG